MQETTIEILNFLSKQECDKIINILLNRYELENAGTMGFDKNENKITEAQLNYTFNKRKAKFIDASDFESLNNKIINKLNELNILKGITYKKINSYTFNKYMIDDFLNWHEDRAEIEFNDATLTIAIQLNEDYEGGEFYYIDGSEQKEFSKKTGTLIIFESTTQHSVDVVKSGMRYSLNCWPVHEKIKSFL
jgi:predicted 2-oxoglutarate/Fe(II)-dependent dioxygenase YbiX